MQCKPGLEIHTAEEMKRTLKMKPFENPSRGDTLPTADHFLYASPHHYPSQPTYRLQSKSISLHLLKIGRLKNNKI